MKKSVVTGGAGFIGSHLVQELARDRAKMRNSGGFLAFSPDVCLKERISNYKTKQEAVSVIGLGYVGLPLACLCAEKGKVTYGIDNDQKKIDSIQNRISPIYDLELQKVLNGEKFIPTTNFRVIRNTRIVVVCVPTPVDKKYDPDFSPLKSTCQEIQRNLKRNHLIIIESTVNPGACEEIVQPILEKSGLQAGKDFDIAHCPERVDPGNKEWSVRNIPRVLGATSKKGLRKALSFYRSILEAEIIPMKSIKEAEATKIVENTFRDINIAFVNELAKSFSAMEIDLTEVIKGASTKPFAFLSHYPGCGIGGHCIPVDPYYLIRQAKNNGFDHKLLKLAREINNGMPAYTVDLLIKALSGFNKSPQEANIGIMGLAYKPNVEDTRESPAYEIIQLLKTAKANVHIYDPFVTKHSTVKSLDELLERSEALVLVTSHQEFLEMNLNKLKDNEIKVVIDGRNCLNKEKIEQLGIVYKGIGR